MILTNAVLEKMTHKRPIITLLFSLFNLAVWMLAASVLMGAPVETEINAAQNQQAADAPDAPYEVVFLAEGAADLPHAARQAVISAAQTWTGTAPHQGKFYLIGLAQGNHWALATLTYADLSGEMSAATHLDELPDTSISPQNLIALLLVDTPAGWQAALDSNPGVHHLLEFVPLTELSHEARQAIFPVNPLALRRGVGQRQQYDGYKLPWPSGYAWARTRTGLGWHGGSWGGRFPENNSLDFAIINVRNSDMLAAAPGIVTHICRVAGQQQAGVVIRTTGTQESLGYLHLASATIPGGVFIGASIRQGDILGRMVEGNVNEACGYSLGTHVHMFLPTRPFRMDGYTFSDTNTQGGISLFSSQPPIGTLPAAPQSRNLVRNGTFSDGFNHWTTQLESAHNIRSDSDGAYVAWQGVTGPAGVLAQMLNYSIPAGAGLEMSLDLGNNTPTEKKLRVHIHNHDGRAIWEDMLVCDFYLPPNTPLQTYTLRRRLNTNWDNMRVWIESSPADNVAAVLTDNVRLLRHDSLNLNRGSTECHSPTPAVAWNFNEAGAPWGWAGNDRLSDPQQQPEGMAYNITGADAALSSPHLTNISAGRYRYLMLEAQFSEATCSRVYFQREGQRGFPPGQYVAFETVPGVFQPYFIYLGSHADWAGGITRLRLNPTCDGTAQGQMTLKQVMFTNADPNLRLLAPVGTLTESYGNPVYRWPHLPDALEYHLYLAPSNDQYRPIINQAISVPLYCDATECSVEATRISAGYWLPNGAYTAYLRARYGNGLGDWSTGFGFTLAAPAPAAPRLENVTGTDIPSRPLFTWALDTPQHQAAWFNLYVAAENDLGNPLVNTWVYRGEACGDFESQHCALRSPVDFPNGAYQVYLQGWSAGGYSAWAGPRRFTLNLPAPMLVTDMQATSAYTRRPALSWARPAHATWYQLWLGKDGAMPEAALIGWYYAGELNCLENPTCTLHPELILDNGRYIWYVQAWGPGGFSAGGIQGWAAGPPFSVGN